jgi:transcription elongation factor S-II
MAPKSKASTSTAPVLILTEKGDVKEGVVKMIDNEVTLESVQGYYKKKQVAECIGTYPYKTSTLFLFGVTEGKEGTENNHQLPPPHDSTTLYGDILLLASKDEESFATAVPFKPSDYEQFYTRSFGGNGSDEDEEEEEVVVEEEKEFVQEDEEPEVEVEEEADDEDDEEEAEVEHEAEEEQDVPVVSKPKAKKKKAPTTTAAAAATSAYPDKPILSEEEQLQEELSPEPTEPAAPIRRQALKSLETIFKDTIDATQIRLLESCIYNGSIIEARRRHVVRTWDYPPFAHIYRMRARNISSNFDSDSYVQNNELFELFQQGSVDFKAISAMNTYELFPSRWRDQFEKQQIREKKQLEGNRDMATDQFLCTRCWKRQCTYYEMQTRSADEPMTIFITCINCGKHWRQ